ncbi:MAG TPA: hypothetical protein DCG19_06585 [Cryomorphaceae bacterium]|nr:hypothetical protein [Owenweeksia sp.]MBF98125.1 hypothetical protein [Owenweeksia sp.]HAD97055.1 hypothetical protein [Cryomorphaceae bacterium]HBF20111.1 hypothetical protein [Cryomorphaceae bacterium]HCQ14711.1 hypothetical protein [Cryomorphaceae bacterium]|tara:strand:- start:7473 stop:8909 length:1437 start_codon:yes stop_codon:yes gene_type:complete
MNFNFTVGALTCLLAFTFSTAQAQEKMWTLDECVNYAIDNNVQVKQSELQLKISKSNQQVAYWDYAPNLNFNSSYGWNFGLNIDPVTNQISQSQRQTGNFNLNSTWVLYNGGRKYNSITRSNLDYLAAMYSLEDVKNDVSLNVAGAFLQILLNKEILNVALEQERITQLQLGRMQRLVDAGARPLGDKLQLDAQFSRDQQNRITAENAVTISKLQLANLLQLEKPEELEVSEPQLAVPEADAILRDASVVYNTALSNQPSIKAAEKRVESSEESVDISRSGALPTLSLQGLIGTSYSDQILRPTGTVTTVVPIGTVDGTNQVVYSAVPQEIPTGYENKPFSDQINDNLNEYIGINLTIPLFNRLSTHNNYEIARLNRDISKLQLEQEKNALRQTIYQAHADAKASYNSYLAAEKAVEASEESFKYAQQRYDVGALSQFDYENAKNNLASAKSEMLRAKYDYIFKIKVLEFYLTNQVKL